MIDHLTPRHRNGQLEYSPHFRYGVWISALNVGTICELEVSTDLMKRGWPVYWSVAPNAPCDLITIRPDRKVIRIEVRAAKKGNFARHGDHDCIAAVEPDGSISYHPNITVFKERRA